jgi:hypothetical protein
MLADVSDCLGIIWRARQWSEKSGKKQNGGRQCIVSMSERVSERLDESTSEASARSARRVECLSFRCRFSRGSLHYDGRCSFAAKQAARDIMSSLTVLSGCKLSPAGP